MSQRKHSFTIKTLMKFKINFKNNSLKIKDSLRGISASIGKKVYTVICLNAGKEDLTRNQMYLLRISYPKILKKLEEKHPKLISQIQNSLFVTESGDIIDV